MPRQKSILRAVLYHRVSAESGVSSTLAPNLVTAEPAALDRQIRHLASYFHPIGADELLAAVAGTHVLPRRAVLVTFDDGYRDFREVAWPMLKRYGVPAILFVPTAHVGDAAGPFWWDAVWQILNRTTRPWISLPDGTHAALADRTRQLQVWSVFDVHLKRMPPSKRRAAIRELGEQLGVEPTAGASHLGWDELRQLHRDGVAIAAHSRTHELLDQVDDGALQAEIAGSRDDVVRELGSAPPIFAYPNGNADRRVVAAVEAAGFQAAFTVRRGWSRLCHDHPMLLRRDHGALGPARMALALIGPVAAIRARLTPALPNLAG